MSAAEIEDSFKRILVGVDDSEDAQKAFKQAIKEALEHDATLVITSIFEPQHANVYQALDKDYVKNEREKVVAAVNEYKLRAEAAGVKKVEMVVAEGDAGETIVKDIIPAADVDLLVIGSLDKKGVKKYFGSQAAYMAKYAPISVMVVR